MHVFKCYIHYNVQKARAYCGTDTLTLPLEHASYSYTICEALIWMGVWYGMFSSLRSTGMPCVLVHSHHQYGLR